MRFEPVVCQNAAGGVQHTMSHEPSTDTPTHDPAPGHGDDHGHDDHGDVSPLGPIDVAAWGAGILGIGVALVIAFAFVIATSFIG